MPSASSTTTRPEPASLAPSARLRRIAPWLIAALAMAWVLRAVIGLPPDPTKLARLTDAFRHVPYAKYLVATVVLLILNCAADSMAMVFTFGWFGCRVPYREMFIVRASTYLLAVIQYYVGQAAIVGYLHQRRGVPIVRASAWILFVSGINMGVLVLLAAIGLVGGDPAMPWLAYVPPAIGFLAVAYALLLLRRPRRLMRIALLAPMFEVGVWGHVKAVAVRLPHVLVLIVWHYLSLNWFGVTVPFFTALVLLPAVFFATALPISVQGLGLSQAAAVYFFGNHDPVREANVLAYSLAMTTVSLVIQIALGLLFLPAGRRLGLESAVESGDSEPTGHPAEPTHR